MPRGDVVERLRSLGAVLGEGPEAELSRGAGAAYAEAIGQVLAEHGGMADELLAAYEQLGIIFEITRGLPDLRDEVEILDRVVQCLRRSFSERAVFVATRDEVHGTWRLHGTAMSVEPILQSLLTRATEHRGTTVESIPARAMPNGIAEVMLGPIHSGAHETGLFAVLVILRTSLAPAFRAAEMMLIESLTAFCGDLIRNHRLVREMRELSVAMVRSLVNAVDQKDSYTCGHSLRVAYYATELGKELHYADADLQMLQWAALLHDVGKIGIRDNVLNKEGKLTGEEFAHIKEHPTRSHRVVQGVPQLAEALQGILHHHERFDGSGYPDGLRGEQIPQQARVIQIADVFDALTSNRSYRKAYGWREALQILAEEAGKTIDPNLQRTFDAMMRERLEHCAEAWPRMVARAGEFAGPTPAHDPRRGEEDARGS